MGMFRCYGCERHLDSKDGEYSVDEDKEYCDECWGNHLVKKFVDHHAAAKKLYDENDWLQDEMMERLGVGVALWN